MRNGLRDALEDEPDFEVVGLASDGVEAVQTAQQVEPDVIVMDVMMPNRDGVDACRDIMELLPDVKVLMLTASTEEDAVVEAVAAGATGYLQKHSGPEELADAVQGRGPGPAADTGEVDKEGLRLAPQRSRARWGPGLGETDRPGEGYPQDVRQRQVVRPDCGGQG